MPSMGGGNGIHGRITGHIARGVGMDQFMRGWICCTNEFTFCLEGKE